MGKAIPNRIDSLSRNGSIRVPWRFLTAVTSIAAFSSLVYVGVPGPGVSAGQISPGTYVARTRFTFNNPVETYKRRKLARERALSFYIDSANWKDGTIRTLDMIFSAVEKGPDLATATGTLQAEGVDIDPAPVWRSVREEGKRRRQMLRSYMALVNSIEADGVIKDDRMDVELSSGRRGLKRPDPTLGLREVVLGGRGQKGVRSMTQARDEMTATIKKMYADDTPLANLLIRTLERDLEPSLIYHTERSRKARDTAALAVENVEESVSEGEILVREGQRIGPTEIEKLDREASAYYGSRTIGKHAYRLAGIVVLIAGMVLLLGWTSQHLEPGILSNPRMMLLVALVDVLVVAAARGVVVAGVPVVLAPVVLVTIMLALAVSRVFAVLNAVALSFLVALVAGPQFALSIPLTVGATIGSLAAAGSSRRSELIRSGALAGIAMFFAVVGVDLATGFEEVDVILEHGGWAILSGVGSGLLGIGVLPIFEVAFGMTTDISLLELSDQNHPALRRLLLEAPGTYQHSLIVGNLSEAGALAIGANALLARVGSYYHDLGKVDRPEYFIENESLGRSRHEGLSPTMSTLIITSHVRDGVSHARQHGLPKSIVDMIAQHHGTTLVEFFYRAASDRAAGEHVDEQIFRYPGPNPRSREAGIVLLADSVEAASRSLEDPTSSRLTKLVKDLSMKRLLDGQFDESGLTLRDLRILRESFVKVLTSMFHSRVPYPGGATGTGK